MEINYIEFPARDLAATKAFFSQVFGWAFQDYGPSYTAFTEAGVAGGFYEADAQVRVDTGSALVILYSPDLETTLDRVEAARGVISKDIFSFPGGRRFHFLEPSGNELAVWSDQPAASTDAAGDG